MDEKGREVYLKLLKMMVAKDLKGNVVKKEWNDLLEWYNAFKESKRCGVLVDGDVYWTSKEILAKERLWLTLRECLLSHRWKEALDTLIVIADTPHYASTYTIPRVGMELMYQMGLSFEMFDKLMVSSKVTNSGLSKKETSIDAFLFSLETKFSSGLDVSRRSVQMFAELTKQLKVRQTNFQTLRAFNSPSQELNVVLYSDMYNGLAAYAKWLLTKIELEGMGEGVKENREKLLEILTVQFKEATGHISRCAEEEGNWSSLVGKVVEMIEYHAVVEENKELLLRAEVVLSIYLKKHPRNIASLKMLYSLYQRHSDIFTLDKQLDLLRQIVELCPSDPLVLNLVKLEKKDKKKVRLLFTFLSYHKNHHRAWMMLVPILQHNLLDPASKRSITTTLHSLISQRELHSSMFFLAPLCKTASDLVVLKACVGCLVMGRKCALYAGVRNIMRHSGNEPALYNLFKSVKHSSYKIKL